jgi:serine/threonine protein kinase
MGYSHRDVKPDNILITSDNCYKLTDYNECIKLGTSNK